MTNRESKIVHTTIHGAATATAAVGFGLAQIPGSDSAVIMPIQTAMIISLGKTFNQSLDKTMALAMLAELSASIVGRGLVIKVIFEEYKL